MYLQGFLGTMISVMVKKSGLHTIVFVFDSRCMLSFASD